MAAVMFGLREIEIASNSIRTIDYHVAELIKRGHSNAITRLGSNKPKPYLPEIGVAQLSKFPACTTPETL